MNVGATPAYLSGYTLNVSSDAEPGSTFEISVLPYNDSALADEVGNPLAFSVGPPCVLTVSCQSAADCDDQVACTADSCDSLLGCRNVDNCPSGQVCNHSTGICEGAAVNPLPILDGETWQYFKGTAEATPGDLTAWTEIGFDDSAWTPGAAGFGYGTGAHEAPAMHTVLNDMSGNYRSFYIRKQFHIDDPALVQTLTLKMYYDDAFVAYLNGTEVARTAMLAGLGNPPTYDQLASAGGTNHEGDVQEVFNLNTFISLLVTGTNVIAIQGHNVTTDSSDFVMRPELSSTEGVTCTDSSECEDGDVCNGIEDCVGSECVSGTPLNCDDTNPCTTDTCNATSGCGHAPVANGTSCADSNVCNGAETCQSGVCQSGTPLDCSDGISCTDDSCDPVLGCQHTDNCPVGQTCNQTSGVCETSATPVTLTFQQGVSDYTGTQDTYLYQSTPDTVEGNLDVWRWDTENPAPYQEIGLIRFDGILGSGPNQIPVGSQINSATLTLEVYNSSVLPAGGVNEVTVDWSEATATWNNFGGEAGVQADEYGALVASAPIAMGTANINVTSSLQAWSSNPADNHGWIFIPQAIDGVQVRSSEYATIANRPKLSVTYEPPQGCTIDDDCDDLLFCNGAETCNQSTHSCEAGTPPDCTDSVACTADSCDEGADTCVHTPNASACNDGNPCTTDTCDIALGCQHTNNTDPCSDGDVCTTNDGCSGGTCVGGPLLNCNDGKACTNDSCNPVLGCQHVDNCPAGEVCNMTTGICEATTEWTAYNDLSWYTGQLQTNITKITSPANEASLPSTGELIDYATGTGTGVTLTVTGGDHLSTIQGANATTGDAYAIFNGIVSTLGVISYIDAAPPGGNLVLTFTGMDSNATYELAFHGHRNSYGWDRALLATISDADAFTNESSAATDNPTGPGGALFDGPTDPSTRLPADNDQGYVARFTNVEPGSDGDVVLTVSFDGTAGNEYTGKYASALMLRATVSAGPCTGDPDCDDDLFCNGSETCNQSTHNCEAGTPPDCSDTVACTADSCNEGTDACVHIPNTSACNDSNPCTTDTCDIVLGCQYTNNTDPCDDGSACTENDACSGGSCQPGTAVDCDDQVACTNDSCNPSTGCQHVDNCPTGQACNHTTGLCEAGSAEPLPILEGDDWRYFKGTQAPPAGWNDTGFDESSWLVGPTGIGYETGTGYEPCIATDLTDMPGNYWSVFARRTFYIEDRADVTSLTFTMDYDDGYIAYINGVQVYAEFPPSPPNYNQPASTPNHEACCGTGTPTGPCPPPEIDLSGFIGDLVAGTNVLAVQVHNRTIDSSDFVFIPTLSATYTEGNALMTCQLLSSSVPPNGSADLEVFVENVNDVRAYQTTIAIARLSGTGTVTVDCPGGVEIDEARSDYIFANVGVDTYPVVNCPALEAASAMFSGSVNVGEVPVYLSGYTLHVSADAGFGSTFGISVLPYDDSALSNHLGVSIPFSVGPACVLTVSGCVDNEDCDDDNVCNGIETCQGGSCIAGTPLNCNDGNPCTNDTCNALSGCAHAPVPNGTSCADSDLCNGAETCQSGSCVAGTPLNCSDGIACTDDSCNPASGCVHVDDCPPGETCNHSSGQCESSSGFVAYNDCVYSNVAQQTDPEGVLVPYLGPNVTTYNIGTGGPGPGSGVLLDQASGDSTGVTVALTESGGVHWNHTIGGTWTSGYTTHAGTDARTTFGGIADITGVVYYGSTGWWVDATFTGLNSQRRYTFATSASRANSAYTARITRFSISGVNGATNASTPGVQEYNGNPLQVYFNTGDNHTSGYVARWTDIDPGPDGSFTVRAQAHSGNEAYAFSVFMLREQSPPECVDDDDCTDGDVCNGSETCDAGTCMPGTPRDCNDLVGCTDDSCDSALGCQNVDNCPEGEICNLSTGVCEVPVKLATIALVPRDTPSPTDTVTVLPTSVTEYLPNDTFFVEVWAQTSEPNGFQSVSADITFNNTVLSGQGITFTPLFNYPGFTNGTINNSIGLVDDLSGSHGITIPPCHDHVGYEPSWARVAIVEMRAETGGVSVLASGDTNNLLWRTGICGLWALDALEIDYGQATVYVVQCFNDADCDDADLCTTESCDLGTNVCVFTPVACNDSNFCTIDACDPATGCVFTTITCNDSVGCTVDYCDEGNDVCVNTANDSLCDDHVFCNGVEICDLINDCQPGAPVDCDDGVDCTVDSCDGDGDVCVSTPDDGLCDDDGLWCNGRETCDAVRGCVIDKACDNSCEQCDEDVDACEWCVFDLNLNGVTDGLDFGFFSGCFGACYIEGEPCFIANFDGDASGCVGGGDFGAFSGCFSLECSECANCWGPGRGAVAAIPDVGGAAVHLVALDFASRRDFADILPTSTSTFAVGRKLYLEVWASRTTGTELGADGLASVYVDLTYDATLLAVQDIVTAAPFANLNYGVSEPSVGRIGLLGGCAPPGEGSFGVLPKWVRVSIVEMRVDAPGIATVGVGSASSPFGVSIFRQFGDLDASRLTFRDTTLRLVEPRELTKPKSRGGRPNHQ
ncbi:MAG: DNRLRE domain-containing protein [Planctomycetota bacterium]